MGRLFDGATDTATLTGTGGGRLFGGASIPTGGTGTGRLSKGTDLRTETGLTGAIDQAGLQEKARAALSEKGEQPKKIFSGGIIMDTFDTLNALQYGVTGVLKGKGFAEGVKTRQSFTDKDALGDYGIPGVIAGIALDIAVDPLTYINPLSAVRKIPGVVKAASTVSDLAKSTKVGDSLARKFIYRFGQDPVYAQIAERTTRNIAVGNKNLLDIARPLTKLDNATQVAVTAARKAGKLDSLAPDIVEKARPAFDEFTRLGREAVKLGLLDRKTYDSAIDTYLPRMYRKFEAPEGIMSKVKTLFDAKPKRLDLTRFMKRSDIPDDIRTAMGEILEAGYPTAKGLVQLNSTLENAKFFRTVAQKWGAAEAGEGMVKLADTKRLGDLAGKFVPRAIADDVNEIVRIKTPAQQALNKVVAGFKFGKVILNPATHARNMASNMVLNNFEGLSPARIDIYAEAAKELTTKGKWYKEAAEHGLGLDVFASKEIKDILLNSPEGASTLGKLGKHAKGAATKIADMYQKEEELQKQLDTFIQEKLWDKVYKKDDPNYQLEDIEV